ncbi:MAG: hypothetical protein K2Z81_17135, partial [Cyanobacteria bacterium]|nr:hypothetical protein [Cyanobacteriota bacterium]
SNQEVPELMHDDQDADYANHQEPCKNLNDKIHRKPLSRSIDSTPAGDVQLPVSLIYNADASPA